MIRHVLTLCVLLAPTVAPAQTPAGGAPVVSFSIFGSNASELQRFHADVFEWKATSGGDITVSVTSPLVGTVGQRAPERLIYVGVADMTATLQRAVARGGTVRFLRLEVPGRVILGMFKDPAGNSIRLVEMENGKAKVPQWLVVRAWWFVGSAGLNREARITGVNLQGRTVLVTGGASGLGGAVVDMVAAAGGRAVILDLNEEKGRAKAERLGNTVRVVKGDVTQEGDVQRAVDMATADFGQLDGVVNAAGIPAAERVLGREGVQPLDHFTRVIHVNLVGTFNVIRLAAAAMDRNEPNAAGERGVIVNTASVAAFDGQIGQAAYSASKGGIVGMTLPIAREFARIGIRVMTIAPGTFDTPLLAALPEAARISLAQQVPFPSRLGRPDEYAALVRHIFENEMLNGEVIRIDGAIRMAPK